MIPRRQGLKANFYMVKFIITHPKIGPKLQFPLASSAICLDRNRQGIESAPEQILSIKLTGMPNFQVKDCYTTMVLHPKSQGI